MSKTPKELAKEYVAGEDYAGEEAAGAYSGFLAGYQAAKDQWISVKDRLPEDGQDVLACVNGQVLISYVHGMKGFSSEWGLAENGETIWPSHWMPLPEPPKETE